MEVCIMKLSLQKRLWLPLVLAWVALLAITVFGAFEARGVRLDERRIALKNIAESTRSIVDDYYRQAQAGHMSMDEAKRQAIARVQAVRYGGDGYITLVDSSMHVVMHPIKPALNGRDMSGFKDPNGVYLYREIAAAGRTGEGYVRYAWPRPNASVPSPKLGYVLSFQPWDWNLVLGVYLDDIDSAFRASLIRSIGLLAVLGGVISLIVWRIVRGVVRQLGGEPSYAVEIASAIARGDLTQPIHTGQPDSLIGAMLRMQEGLRALVERFNRSAQQLSGAASSLRDEVDQLSRSARHSSESTTAMSSDVQQMAVSIAQVSNGARDSEASSLNAATLAGGGETLALQAASEIERIAADVDDAAKLVKGLAERSREIGGVAAVIRDIADQTNLLALNAAIEAARAGEQGRGFAVVADEVRKLAERTANATQEINQTIVAVQGDTDLAVTRMAAVHEQVGVGVGRAGEAAAALREIRGSVHDTLERIREVASATSEQNQAGDGIARGIESVAQRMVAIDGSLDAAREHVLELDALAQQLHQAAAGFKV
jgi:methyl-accepting chemotaxis protein